MVDIYMSMSIYFFNANDFEQFRFLLSHIPELWLVVLASLGVIPPGNAEW